MERISRRNFIEKVVGAAALAAVPDLLRPPQLTEAYIRREADLAREILGDNFIGSIAVAQATGPEGTRSIIKQAILLSRGENGELMQQRLRPSRQPPEGKRNIEIGQLPQYQLPQYSVPGSDQHVIIHIGNNRARYYYDPTEWDPQKNGVIGLYQARTYWMFPLERLPWYVTLWPPGDFDPDTDINIYIYNGFVVTDVKSIADIREGFWGENFFGATDIYLQGLNPAELGDGVHEVRMGYNGQLIVDNVLIDWAVVFQDYQSQILTKNVIIPAAFGILEFWDGGRTN